MKCITSIAITYMPITHISMETEELSMKLVIKTQELENIHPSIKTDLANAENHRSTKSHSRSYSHNHIVGVGLIDENRPKPMNSASK